MESHQSNSQNTLRFLVEKIFHFKVDSCSKKNKSLCLTIELTSVARLVTQCDSDVYHIGKFRCPSAKLQSQSTNRKLRNVNLLISLIYLCSSPAYAARSRGPFLGTLMWSRPVFHYFEWLPYLHHCLSTVSRSCSPVPHPCPEARSEESKSGWQI